MRRGDMLQRVGAMMPMINELSIHSRQVAATETVQYDFKAMLAPLFTQGVI